MTNDLFKKSASFTSSVIVSFSTEGDDSKSVLVIGKRDKEKLTILNAIQGEDAKALWDMLTIKEEKKRLNRQKFIKEMQSNICLNEKDRRRIIKCTVINRSKKTNCMLTIEEMAELTQQLTKQIRGIGDDMGTLEELADVYVSLQVIEHVLQIDPSMLRKAMDIKLRREMERSVEN